MMELESLILEFNIRKMGLGLDLSLFFSSSSMGLFSFFSLPFSFLLHSRFFLFSFFSSLLHGRFEKVEIECFRLDFLQQTRVRQTQDASFLNNFKNMLTNEIVSKIELNCNNNKILQSYSCPLYRHLNSKPVKMGPLKYVFEEDFHSTNVT